MATILQELGFSDTGNSDSVEAQPFDQTVNSAPDEHVYDGIASKTYDELSSDPTELTPTPPEFDAVEAFTGPMKGGVSIAGKGIAAFSEIVSRFNKIGTTFPPVQAVGEFIEVGQQLLNYATRKSAQFYAQHNARGKMSKEEADNFTRAVVDNSDVGVKDVLDVPMSVVSPAIWKQFLSTTAESFTTSPMEEAADGVPTFGEFLGEKYYETLTGDTPSDAWVGLMNFAAETLVTAPSATASVARRLRTVGEVQKLIPSKPLRPFEIKALREFYSRWGVERLGRDPLKGRLELKRLSGIAKYTDDARLEKALSMKAINYKKELELMLGRPLREARKLPKTQLDQGRLLLDTILADVEPARKAADAQLKVSRAKKFAKAVSRRGGATGETAAKKARWALRGEDFAPKFEGDLSFVTQEMRDELFDIINALPEWDAQHASTGMWKILDNTIPVQSEIKAIEQAFGPGVLGTFEALAKQKVSLPDIVNDLINVPRAVQTSFDMGAPIRQGNFGLKAGYADEWGDAFVKMMKAGRSEEYADLINNLGRKGPRSQLYKEAGLEITDLGRFSKLSAREEQYLGTFAEKIPIIGRGVKWSARVHSAFLNQFRMNIFDSVVAGWRAEGRTLKPQDLKSLAEYVNHVSGRGDLKAASRVVTKAIGKTASEVQGFKLPSEASLFLYSPKFLLSKIQVHTDLLTAQSPTVRKLIARDLRNYYYTNMQFLRLTKQLEGQVENLTVEDDPTSTEFGKIRIGNTRFDVWGPMNPMMRFMSRIESGVRKDSISGEVKDIDKTKLTLRFLRGKLSPAAGLAFDVGTKKTFVGEDVDITSLSGLGEITLDRVVPLVATDIIDAFRFGDNGFLAKAATGSAFFGQGVVSYEPTPYQKAYQKKETLGQEIFGKPMSDLDVPERMALLRIAKADPEIALLEREGMFERSDDLGEIYADVDRQSEKQIKKLISPHSRTLIDRTFTGVLGVNRSIYPQGKRLKLTEPEFKRYKKTVAKNIDKILDGLSPTGTDNDSLFLDAKVMDRAINDAIKLSQRELLGEIAR